MSSTESSSKSNLNPSEESSSKKDETSSLVETNTNESLHLGSDLLADKLDYEIDEEPDELEEQEDVDLSLLNSPANENEASSHSFTDYDTDLKTDGASPTRVTKENAEDGVVETSAVTLTKDGEVSENKEKEDLVNDDQTKYDTAADLGLNIKNDNKDDKSEAKETSDKSATSNNEHKSAEIDEDLEEGEVSDEDEEARKERLKPQPVCRFYSKGACTWGSSCRFIHPGVLDTGRSVL